MKITDILKPPERDCSIIHSDIKHMMPGMLVEQIASVLLDNINVFVMGFIGRSALAGVSQVSTINNTLMIFFQFFAFGGTALVARAVGAGNTKDAEKTAGTALIQGLIFSMAVSLILFTFCGPFLHLLFGAADAEVLANSVKYFRITVFAPPLWFVYYQCSGFMRSLGDTKRPVIVSAACNVMSIILNVILTFKMGLGVTGAALSYTLSVLTGVIIAICLVFHHSFKMHPMFIIDSTTFIRMKEISRIAIPSSIEMLAFNGSKLVIQVLIAGMGTIVISANQVFNSASNFLMIPFLSLNALTMPIIGRSCGRESMEQVGKDLYSYAREGRFYALWTGLAHLVLAVPAVLLFTRDMEVVPKAVAMVMIYGLFSPFMSECFILPNGFKALGDAKFTMYYSAASAWIFRVLGTYVFGVLLGLSNIAIVLMQGADHISRFLVYRNRLASGKWIRKYKESNINR